MIEYQPGLFGLRNLARVHGSAAYKVLLPSIVSSLIVVVAHVLVDDTERIGTQETIRHPYGIAAFVGFFGILLTFRLNHAYGRYWDGCTAIHQMVSKWLDTAMCLAAFHYQSNAFNDIKPEAFGRHPKVDPSRVKRDRDFDIDHQEAKENIQFALEEMDKEHKGGKNWLSKYMNSRNSSSGGMSTDSTRSKGKSINSSSASNFDPSERIPIPTRFQGTRAQQIQFRGSNTHKSQGTSLQLERSGRLPSPSLFLQEAAHLVSLLSAVAMSTLRNDVEVADSPLVEYIPGSTWPPTDPDDLAHDIKQRYGEDNVFWRWLNFMLSLNRSERHRTLYNAARPFGVLGGVSDREIELLQRARGPYAKTSLCTMWLQEFISRESLNGSTGAVHGPVLSRLYQFISDGMVGYNQARKVSYIPFPFVNAQIISLLSLVVILLFPLLYYSYVNQLWFACMLNGITVMCFLGLHEVARELENPMQNVPNDLPLTTFQAQLNESLVAMYAGYHPDSWWELKKSK